MVTDKFYDVMGGNGYPSGDLSNLKAHKFTFDGVECASMEGFLQSIKFPDRSVQLDCCKLSGLKAKRFGQKQPWYDSQRLYWNDVWYDRHGMEYQQLIDRAYDALATNVDFQLALLETGSATLTHKIGNSNPKQTILTEKEFCDRLHRLRTQLQYSALLAD